MCPCAATLLASGVLSRILTWSSRHRSRLGMPPCRHAHLHMLTNQAPYSSAATSEGWTLLSAKNWARHIDASHSQQPLVKGERSVRCEANAVIQSQVQDRIHQAVESTCVHHSRMRMVHVLHQVIHRLLITTGCCMGHDSVTEWFR